MSDQDNRVKIKSGDSHIWDANIAMIEIITKLYRHGNVIIDFNLEAPDIQTTELNDVLNYLHAIGFKKNQISVITGNMVESYDKFSVIKEPNSMYELPLYQALADNVSKTKQIEKHFGCFIGRSNINRLIIAGYLNANYADKTSMTYHFIPGNDFHRVHLGLEDILYHFGPNSSEFNEAVALIQKSPIKNDHVTYVYPIVDHTEVFSRYKNIFVDIVCETFSNGNVFFLTEKFWRAIVTKTPFIIQGPQFTLKRLKQLGFKTFNQWWDEGYDEDPYLCSQVEIKKVIEHLSKFTIAQLTDMHVEMQSTLDNNYNCMMNLTIKDLSRVT